MSTSAEYIPGVAELGRKNQAGGYVGINGSGVVLGTFAQRRDTAANIAGIVLANGELAFTTDTQETFIGDGVTAGGLFLHQKTRVQTYTGSDTLVSTPPSPVTDALLLIPAIVGAAYRIKATAKFTDSSNTSNFMLRTAPTSGRVTLQNARETWAVPFTSSGYLNTILEERALPYPDGPVQLVAALKADLTRGSASLLYDVEASVTVDSTIRMWPVPRSGSTSPATAAIVYQWRRIR